MADRLTQLQDCLDDLLTQMYASLSYIRQRHPYGEIEGQPSLEPQEDVAKGTLTNGNKTTQSQSQTQPDERQPANDSERLKDIPPEDPHVFHAALHELARDLVVKEQQIEYLINNLPGIGSSEAEQEKRIRELEVELKNVEAERARAEEEREVLVEGLGRAIVGVRRVP